MASPSTSIVLAEERGESPPASLRWRSWPLVEHRRWSWLVPLGVLAVGGLVLYQSESWLMAGFAIMVVSIALWQFWLPVTFEIDASGLSRQSLGRTRLMRWSAVRAYQPRATGIVLFQRPDPVAIDALRGIFLPYGEDEDETLSAVRQYLPHAVELPG